MTWHGAFMMIPINIGQFQIKYWSVAVELSVINSLEEISTQNGPPKKN